MTTDTETLTALLDQFKRLGWSTGGWRVSSLTNKSLSKGEWLWHWSDTHGTSHFRKIEHATPTDLDTLLGIGVWELGKVKMMLYPPLTDNFWRVVIREYVGRMAGLKSLVVEPDPYSALLAACRQLPTPKETADA